jgi:hypothetical protein
VKSAPPATRLVHRRPRKRAEQASGAGEGLVVL